MAPHNVYPCQGEDSWIAIAVEDDKQWQALVQVLGTPIWTQDSRFATGEGRYQHQEEIDTYLGQWTRDKEHRKVMIVLQEAGVPAGAVLRPDEMLDDPQLVHREFYRDIPGTDLKTTSVAWQFADTSLDVRKGPPEFGETNNWILRDLLDLPDSFITTLQEKNVISYGLPT
jgi:crotonobetainyl-CoA:carnitine CoA-transferase CaiB-like acyl-CoA transferase